LPRRVYLRHKAYYFVTLPGKWIRLSAEKNGLPAMYRALAELQEQHSARGEAMPAVIKKWLDAKRAGWSASQKRNMERMADVVATAFAEFSPSDVTTPDCAAFLARYADKARTHNIYRDILRQVLAHAALLGLREGWNPIDNIKGLSTPGRRRIVSDDEIERIRAAALSGPREDASGRALVQMLDLALITGQRVSDLLAMRWQDVRPGGVFVQQGKTGARMLIEWTPALRSAVDACAVGTTRIGHLIKNRAGKAYTYAGMRSAWVRTCAKAGVEDLNIHDLRGRAGVDALEAGDLEAARALLGHKTQRMTAHYTDGKHVPKVRPAK
jgi:integrase